MGLTARFLCAYAAHCHGVSTGRYKVNGREFLALVQRRDLHYFSSRDMSLTREQRRHHRVECERLSAVIAAERAREVSRDA